MMSHLPTYSKFDLENYHAEEVTDFRRYMSISFHLAELVQKIRISAIAERKANLLRARDHYERFVKLLDSYDVLGKSDAKLWESYLENKQQFSTASTRDAAARRDAKIQRFREEKELKKKLEASSFPHRLMCTSVCEQGII
jgi:hypothetical protein